MGPLLGTLLREVAKKGGKSLARKGQALDKQRFRPSGRPPRRDMWKREAVDAEYAQDLAPYGGMIPYTAAGAGAGAGLGAALGGAAGVGGRMIPPFPPGAIEFDDGGYAPSVTVPEGLGKVLEAREETTESFERELEDEGTPKEITRPLANSAHQNASFFTRPDVRAGMIQMGLALMSGANMGQAGAAGFGAAGRYNQQQQQRAQQQQELHMQKMEQNQRKAESDSLIALRKAQREESEWKMKMKEKALMNQGTDPALYNKTVLEIMKILPNTIAGMNMAPEEIPEVARTMADVALGISDQTNPAIQNIINQSPQIQEVINATSGAQNQQAPNPTNVLPVTPGVSIESGNVGSMNNIPAIGGQNIPQAGVAPTPEAVPSGAPEVAGQANHLGTNSVSLLDAVKNIMAGYIGPANPDMMTEGPVEIPQQRQAISQPNRAIPEPNFYDPSTMSDELPPEFERTLEEGQNSIQSQLYNDLSRHEGFSAEQYLDPIKGEDAPTIGYGTNLNKLVEPEKKILAEVGWTPGSPISEETAFRLMMAKEAYNTTQFERLTGIRLIDHPPEVQRALRNMAYQHGGVGLAEYDDTLAFIRQRRYKEAAQEARNSLWYRKQSPNRAEEVLSLLERAG